MARNPRIPHPHSSVEVRRAFQRLIDSFFDESSDVDHGGVTGLGDDDHTHYSLPANLGRGSNALIVGNDKICFTNADGSEYISSLNAGYLDLAATTAVRIKSDLIPDGNSTRNLGATGSRWNHFYVNGNIYTPFAQDSIPFIGSTSTLSVDKPNLNFNNVTNTLTAGNIISLGKIAFTQLDLNEYIDSLNDGYMDYGATTAHRFDADIHLNNNLKILLGTSGSNQQSISGDGTNLIINSEDVTSEVHFTNFDIKLFNDKKAILGTGSDSSIYYNDTNLILEPDVVGTGGVVIKTNTKTMNAFIVLDSNSNNTFEIAHSGANHQFIATTFGNMSTVSVITFRFDSYPTGTVGTRSRFQTYDGNNFMSSFEQGKTAHQTGFLKIISANSGVLIETFRSDSGQNYIRSNSVKLYWGAVDDASIYYDGDDFIFDSQETGSGDFYFKNGNVGIGTASPSQKLTVAGTISLSSSGTDVSLTGVDEEIKVQVSNTGTYYSRGLSFKAHKYVDSGRTDSGYSVGFWGQSFAGIEGTHDGVLDNIRGGMILAGIYGAGHSGSVTTVHVLRLAPYAWSGTIGTIYNLYIDVVTGAGTINTKYSIWDASGWDWVLDGDNQKIRLGETQGDMDLYSDGTDAVIEAATDIFLNAGGLVKFGTKTGTGDVAIDGYVTIKDSADNTIKLATVA